MTCEVQLIVLLPATFAVVTMTNRWHVRWGGGLLFALRPSPQTLAIGTTPVSE